MSTRRTRQSVAGSLVLLSILGTGVEGQLGALNVTAHSGVAVPVGGFADYMDVGPSFGLEVTVPDLGPADLVLSGGADFLNGNSTYGLPDMRLWRYQAGVEAEILGRDSEQWGLRAGLAAGATTFGSGGFLQVGSPTIQSFEGTYFTGSGGLELVLEAYEDVEWYVGARGHWSLMDEDDTQVLRNRAPNVLGAVRSSVSVPVTLGLRFHTS